MQKWLPYINFCSHLFVSSPDFRGGFELHNAEEVEKESHLLDELGKFSLSGAKRSQRRSFTPLLDIPVDEHYTQSDDLDAPSTSASALPNWLLAHADDPRPPIGTIRSVHFDEVSLHSTSDRGRSTVSQGPSRGRESGKDGGFTLQSAARRTRPLLSQVFSLRPGQQTAREQTNGHQPPAENGLNGSEPEEEHRLQTVSISKHKQSLGKRWELYSSRI